MQAGVCVCGVGGRYRLGCRRFYANNFMLRGIALGSDVGEQVLHCIGLENC